MKICKPVTVTRRSQSLPAHIPRQMPAIYQLLEGIEERVKLLGRAVYQRSRTVDTKVDTK